MTDKKSLQTLLTATEYRAPDGFAAFPMAIHHASTVLFKDVAALRARTWQDKSAYTYGLHGTPTTFTLEARLAEIEAGRHCLLAPSGLAAIAMVNLALLKSGDDVLLPENVYTPNRDLGSWLAQDFGVSVRYYDPMMGSGIAALIEPNTRLIWTEAPGSVSMEVPDIGAEQGLEAQAELVVEGHCGHGVIGLATEEEILRVEAAHVGLAADLHAREIVGIQVARC